MKKWLLSAAIFTLTVEPSSYAEQYAVENGIAYAYPDSEDGLNG